MSTFRRPSLPLIFVKWIKHFAYFGPSDCWENMKIAQFFQHLLKDWNVYYKFYFNGYVIWGLFDPEIDL